MTKRPDRGSGHRCAVYHREAQERYRETEGGRKTRRDNVLQRSAKRGQARIDSSEAELREIRDRILRQRP
jgi:hypothetical protein